jgi:hypothetical protein
VIAAAGLRCRSGVWRERWHEGATAGTLLKLDRFDLLEDAIEIEVYRRG